MALAIFDLDETLIGTDSDHAWGVFVADQNLADPEEQRRQADQFYQDYKEGRLDIDAYMRFACSVLPKHSMETLHSLREVFFNERVRPHILPRAVDLVEEHRSKGDCLVIITATIQFVTEPIADFFGIEHLIAPVPEIRDNHYTGEIVGIPSFREGKVTRLKDWLTISGESLEESCFYSDSINDLPLLELVDHPVAVDPDAELRLAAEARGWPIISLRE